MIGFVMIFGGCLWRSIRKLANGTGPEEFLVHHQFTENTGIYISQINGNSEKKWHHEWCHFPL